MNTGVLGINGSGAGVNDDNLAAYVKQLGSAYCVSLNNPKLAKLWQANGTRTIYRKKTADSDDDKINLTDDLEAMQADANRFVDLRIAEADSDSIISACNEPFVGRLDLLNLWTMYFVDRLRASGRTGCILNLSEGNPKIQAVDGIDEWALLDQCVRHNAQYGGVLGMHDYISDDLNDSFKYHAGRWFPMYDRFNCQVVVTETGYAGGWEGAIDQMPYAHLIDGALDIYRPRHPAVCIFDWGFWKE